MLALLTAFVLSCGGHWVVLQGIAWVNMVREYSEHVSVVEAVGMTVSGKFPCKMCKAIADKRQQEKKDKHEKLPDFKKEFLVAAVLPAPRLISLPLVYPVAREHRPQFEAAPPTPPPRLA